MYQEINLDTLISGELAVDQWQVLDRLWISATGSEHEFVLSYTWGKETHNVNYLQYYPLTETRFSLPASTITIQPNLADRAIIARPNKRLYIPAGHGIQMIIGSPIWVNIGQGEHSLVDLPVSKLSDTWFGANTMSGELCYASETHARFSVEGVKANPWKALTPVQLQNSGEDGMYIERVNIPLPNLSLYRDDSRLWTSPVRITRTSTEDVGEVKVSAKPPGDAVNAIKIAEPRKNLEGGVVKRAMGLLFG